MISIPDSARFAHTLVKRGIAEWHGGKPVIKPLQPRKGPAMIADAVSENRGRLSHDLKLTRAAAKELKKHKK